MVGMHFELTFGVEKSCSDGMLSFTVYGPDLAHAKSWGDKLAWDYIHEKRPTDRVLKDLKFAPVAPYLVTAEGPQALDYIDLRKINEARNFEELGAFGLGSTGYVGRPSNPQARADLPPDFTEADNLDQLREFFSSRHKVGSRERSLFLERTNWDPAQQALYQFIRVGEDREAWLEAVFCRAVNFAHAAAVWHRHCRREPGAVESAVFHLAHSFCAALRDAAVSLACLQPCNARLIMPKKQITSAKLRQPNGHFSQPPRSPRAARSCSSPA